MENLDRIILGDNQFFGINHMSQEKAQQLAEQFFDIENIFRVYRMAYDAGVRGIMLNSNDRAREICEFFRKNAGEFPDLHWYPSIPYPHKYANLVAEKGIFPAINEILFTDQDTKGFFNMITKGGTAVLTKDAIKLMEMLIDLEMKMFKGLNIKVVFLQNIVTDLLLGYKTPEVFEAYNSYIRKKYNAWPGLITQNLPILKSFLEEHGIKDVVICSSINKIGYLMSPGIREYEETLATNDSSHYPVMAMSTLASGAISPKSAYEYINNLNIQSVVFGASSKKHIEETVNLIMEK